MYLKKGEGNKGRRNPSRPTKKQTSQSIEPNSESMSAAAGTDHVEGGPIIIGVGTGGAWPPPNVWYYIYKVRWINIGHTPNPVYVPTLLIMICMCILMCALWRCKKITWHAGVSLDPGLQVTLCASCDELGSIGNEEAAEPIEPVQAVATCRSVNDARNPVSL